MGLERIQEMSTPNSVSVLIVHPYFGSVWLTKAEWHGDVVEGETWDDSDVGSANLPDDWRGEPAWMNFPISCVRKVRVEAFA